MAMRGAVTAAALAVVLALLCFTPPGVWAIESKCSACQAVAAELETALTKERPRNHLDMRHRLNSQGQREGKVIDYRLSELRVVELLDGLCKTMSDYGLVQKYKTAIVFFATSWLNRRCRTGRSQA
eukprot:jgi/Chlat1/1816/Chrsp135S02140